MCGALQSGYITDTIVSHSGLYCTHDRPCGYHNFRCSSPYGKESATKKVPHSATRLMPMKSAQMGRWKLSCRALAYMVFDRSLASYGHIVGVRFVAKFDWSLGVSLANWCLIGNV